MAMRGKVALVTGAGSGMGRLATWRLASEGVEVAAVDVDATGLGRTAAHAPQVHPMEADVSDADSLAQVVQEAGAALGPLDRVVHAAAIAPSGRLVEQDPGEMARIMSVNYVGTVNVVAATLPAMLERGRGDLVLFGSLAGWLPSPYVGAYSASKAAVVSYAETLWHELGPDTGVRLVCTCPPIVDTPMLDQIDPRPPFYDAVAPIRPEAVLDAIEDALEKGELWSFPGRGTRAVWRVRRFVPATLWRRLEALDS